MLLEVLNPGIEVLPSNTNVKPLGTCKVARYQSPVLKSLNGWCHGYLHLNGLNYNPISNFPFDITPLK